MNTTTSTNAGLQTAILTGTRKERRRNRRCKITQPVRVRPSEFVHDEFEEILTTENVARDGLYFISERQSYVRGMGLFVTFPFSKAADALNMDYLARVVRVDTLPGGRRGIAVQFITPMGFKR